MFASDQYALLDVGAGRRLERFGSVILDRPAPAASDVVPRDPAIWSSAHAWFVRHEGGGGTWGFRRRIDPSWQIRHGSFALSLRCGESGAIGVYPEQADNWRWIADQVRGAARPVTVLNLFAYTGGSTLAAAAAGARVVHVDAARSVVQWARRNAHLSGMHEAPIRWVVEDARKFVQRELRRGNRYQGIMLDPPTYGHGPKAQPWRWQTHLEGLWREVIQLLDGDALFVLMTSHTPGVGPPELTSLFRYAGCPASAHDVDAHHLYLDNAYGQRLASGVVARWPND
jgi:23S rRNA (cytosine1962-C5)-methyltransferase